MKRIIVELSNEHLVTPSGLTLVCAMLGNLVVDTFISDSANDNYATYQLLDEWGINAVIALNKKNKGKRIFQECVVNDDGIPICPAGHMMVKRGTLN